MVEAGDHAQAQPGAPRQGVPPMCALGTEALSSDFALIGPIDCRASCLPVSDPLQTPVQSTGVVGQRQARGDPRAQS